MSNTIEPLQWLSMLASFALVLALLGATLWVLRRMGGRGMRVQGRRLAIVESIWLGPRQRVAIVRVDDQDLVIAVSQQQVTLLATLPTGRAAPGDQEAPDGQGGQVDGSGSREPADPAVADRFRQAMRALSNRLPGSGDK
jgi:flagellar protein FliO/FliZ